MIDEIAGLQESDDLLPGVTLTVGAVKKFLEDKDDSLSFYTITNKDVEPWTTRLILINK